MSTDIDAADQSWSELIRNSRAYLDETQTKLETDFHLSQHERWEIDQDKGELLFLSGGAPAVVAKFQFVGSYSSTDHTWLWGWGNKSVLPALSTKIRVVKEYGEKRHFAKLRERKWDAEEADGWDMAAIANYLLKAKGVYRPPYSKGVSFVVITDIQQVKSN